MEKKQIRLVCRSVIYYSQNDESAFFEWIKKIPSIENYYGERDELYLNIKNTNIDEADLEELLALFFRYKIKDMTQLKIFLNDKNKEWFSENPDTFWHELVFGEPRIKLICDNAKFESDENEELFSKLMIRIPCVDEVDDFHTKIHVYAKSKNIPEQDLRDILGMFYQYKIDMAQLQIFLNNENKKWFFEDKDTYWHNLVFGKN